MVYFFYEFPRGHTMIRQGFALFDLDGTVSSGDSILPMIRYAIKTRFAKKTHMPRVFLALLGYSLHLLSDTKAKEIAIAFLKGKTKEQVASFAENFCRDVLFIRIYKGAREEIKTRREEGLRVLLVTASPDFYLQPLIRELALDGIIGTRADITPDGIYTGRIAGLNCRNVEKPLRIAEYLAARGYELDTESSYAYGDSGHDWPMMSLTKNPVAVNAKKELLARCGNCRRVDWK
jgi:HAD superfamily hydrolase (TIGR01490 family)